MRSARHVFRLFERWVAVRHCDERWRCGDVGARWQSGRGNLWDAEAWSLPTLSRRGCHGGLGYPSVLSALPKFQ